MEKQRSHMTERMLNLTLEIIYLLTGENYIAFKLSAGLVATNLKKTVMETASNTMRKNNKKIEQVTNEIIELLMGQVSVPCQDGTVPFSLEEWEYLEGHKDAMMEKRPSLITPDGSRTIKPARRCPTPSISPNVGPDHLTTLREYQVSLDVNQIDKRLESREEEEGLYASGDDAEHGIPPEISRDLRRTQTTETTEETEVCVRIKEEEIPIEIISDGSSNRNTPERCCQPQTPHLSMQEHHVIDQDENMIDTEVKEEAEESYVRGDMLEEETPVEISPGFRDTGTGQRDVKAEEEENLRIKEEEISLEIGTDGKTIQNRFTVSPGGELQDDDLSQDSSEENLIPPYLHQVFPSADVSSDPSIPGGSFFENYFPIPHHTDYRDDDIFPCSFCGKYFAQESTLISHQRTHTAEKPFKCSICGKSFTQKSCLVLHQQIHSAEKPYPRSEWGKCLPQLRTLTSHQRTHTGDKPFSCSECGKCFTMSSALSRHQRIHTGEKPYSCSECGKCFSQRSHLITHEKLHTGEKPYKCLECGKCFSQRSHLITHEKLHTGEKPFSCSECGKRFSRRSHLLTHEKLHTGEKPYKCSSCGKCFTRRSHLVTHEKLHSGEKPHTCIECGKCFTRKSHLITHEKLHTGEKPFRCLVCGKCFSREGSLIKHQRAHSMAKSYSCSK